MWGWFWCWWLNTFTRSTQMRSWIKLKRTENGGRSGRATDHRETVGVPVLTALHSWLRREMFAAEMVTRWCQKWKLCGIMCLQVTLIPAVSQQQINLLCLLVRYPCRLCFVSQKSTIRKDRLVRSNCVLSVWLEYIGYMVSRLVLKPSLNNDIELTQVNWSPHQNWQNFPICVLSA